MDKSNKFYELFTDFVKDKKQICIPTQQKYEEMVTTIQKRSGETKDEKNRLTKSEFNLLSRYTLRVEQSKSVLYHGGDPKEKENKPKRVVTRENLFELLHTTHAKLGHGGTGVMWRELQGYFGISKDILAIFLKLCVECELKKGKAKKGIVVKPILSKDHNSRCQVDLIDLQSCPVDGFKHIMVYQDHLTKFVVLRALREKTAFEVVAHLTEIFSTFGCPQILQSDNGREFANRLVNELLRQWPESKIVHGRPRHSQSQGSVERANQDIERILCTFLRDNQSSNWVRALPKVQAMKNRRYHSGIGRSPFEAMFGRKMQLGSEDGNFPSEEDRGILATEEGEEEKEDGNTFDWSEAVKNAATGDPNFFPTSDEEEIEEAEEANDLNTRDEQIQEHRAGARAYQEKQAQQMLEASNKRYSQVEVGQSVRIAIDPVDRPKLGHHNVLAVVTNVNEEGQYKMGTKGGTLPQRFSRNQFEPCSSQFLNLDDVPDGEISFRAAVGAESAVGVQGHKHCGCTGDCSNRKCACFKAGRICNSRCHHSNPCKNK